MIKEFKSMIAAGKWKGTEEELHDYLLYIKKYNLLLQSLLSRGPMDPGAPATKSAVPIQCMFIEQNRILCFSSVLGSFPGQLIGIPQKPAKK